MMKGSIEMKRIVLSVMFAMLLVSCSQNEEVDLMSDYLNDDIDFTEVEAFDYDRAIERIEAELDQAYVPDLAGMYQGVREYSYGVQTDWASIFSEYEFDDPGDRNLRTEASAHYGPIENKGFFANVKEYGWHLIKKLFGASRRINENGFKGYSTRYGAKLDQKRFYLIKDDYQYNFRMPNRTPDGYDDFDFVDYTLNHLHKANDYWEWEALEAGILQKVQLPDASKYRLLNFTAFYHDGEQAGGKLQLYFDHDEVIFKFGAFEDEGQVDALDVYGFMSKKRDLEDEVSDLELANGLQVKRH